MESSNNIVVAVFMAIIILPILLVARSINKKKKMLAAKAAQLQAQHQLQFTETDRWDNIILGLDAAKGKLLWAKTTADGEQQILLDLGHVSRCKKLVDSRSVTYNKETSQATDSLSLEFLMNEGKGKSVVLEFYNVKSSFMLNTQFELLDKWHHAITQLLTKVAA